MSEWLHSAFYRDENERFYASLYRSRSLNDTSCTSSRSQASPKTPPSLAPLDLPPAAWSAPSSYLSNDGRSLAFHGNGDTYAPLLSPTTSAAYHTLPSFAPSTQQHAVPSPPRYLDPSLIANAAVYRLSSSPPKRSHDSQSQRKSTTRTIIDTKQKCAASLSLLGRQNLT